MIQRRNLDLADEMFRSGSTVEEVSAKLGLSLGTARDYRTRKTRGTSASASHRNRCKYDQEQTHCPRCGLRGAHECLPASAVAFLGRRDEPVACSSGLRSFGGGA